MLEKILRIENEKTSQIIFWALIGPVFLLLDVALASFQQFSASELFMVAALGLFLCFKKARKGLYSALFLLAAVAAYKHTQLYQYHVFELGLEISLALSLISCHAAFEYVKDEILKMQKKEDQSRQEILKAEEKLAREIDFHARQQKNFKFEMDRLGELLEEKKQEADTLKSLTENLRRSLVEKEEKLELWQNEQQSAKSLLSAIEEKQQQLEKAEKQIGDMKQTELLYSQLKIQFEEKKEVVQNVRKELFLAKEEAEKLRRQIKDNNSEDNPYVRELQKEMVKLNEELKRFEKDSGALEEIISRLVEENTSKTAQEKTLKDLGQDAAEEKQFSNICRDLEKKQNSQSKELSEQKELSYVEDDFTEENEGFSENAQGTVSMPEAPSDFSDYS